MRIIPAIDIVNKQCVRLFKGDFSKKTVYKNSPVEQAKLFEELGCTYLHLVDLEGAKHQQVIHWNELKQICASTKLSVDFSGGIRSEEDIKQAFDLGANNVVIGSLAVKNTQLVQQWVSNPKWEGKIFISADVNNLIVQISGWNESSSLTLNQLITLYDQYPIAGYIVTDISKDGTLEGPSSIYKDILQQYPTLKLIASGGVSRSRDLFDLQKIGCFGTIIGKAYYEQTLEISPQLHSQIAQNAL